MNKKTLKEIFDIPIGQFLEMDKNEINNLITKVDLLHRCLRGIHDMRKHCSYIAPDRGEQ